MKFIYPAVSAKLTKELTGDFSLILKTVTVRATHLTRPSKRLMQLPTTGSHLNLMKMTASFRRFPMRMDLELQDGDIVRNISVNIRFYEGWDEWSFQPFLFREYLPELQIPVERWFDSTGIFVLWYFQKHCHSKFLLLFYCFFCRFRSTSIAAAITPESTRIPTNTSSGVLSPVFGLDAVFTLCDTAVVLPPGLPCTVVALLSAVVDLVVGIRVMTGVATGFLQSVLYSQTELHPFYFRFPSLMPRLLIRILPVHHSGHIPSLHRGSGHIVYSLRNRISEIFHNDIPRVPYIRLLQTTLCPLHLRL